MVEKSPASASVAEKLEIEAEDLVMVRRRQDRSADVPWMMLASYFPLDIAAGTPLEQAGDITGGSIKLLADLGYAQLGFVDEIGARMPNAREFTFFGLSTGTPVIVVNRTAYTRRAADPADPVHLPGGPGPADPRGRGRSLALAAACLRWRAEVAGATAWAWAFLARAASSGTKSWALMVPRPEARS